MASRSCALLKRTLASLTTSGRGPPNRAKGGLVGARLGSSVASPPKRIKAPARGGSRVPPERRNPPGVYHLTQLFAKFLRSGEDRKAAKLLDGMKSMDSQATVAVCNYLLNSCSKCGNAEMAKEVWGFMAANGVRTNTVSYGCMLSALSRGGRLEEALELLQLLSERKEANLVMYNIVLNACTHTKSKVYASRCLQLMEVQGVAKDELSYVQLIRLSGLKGDLDAVREWWIQLTRSFPPKPSSRSPYIVALSRMNELTEARQELQRLVSDLGLDAGISAPGAAAGQEMKEALQCWAGTEEAVEGDGVDRASMKSRANGVAAPEVSSPPGISAQESDPPVGGWEEERDVDLGLGPGYEAHPVLKKAPIGSPLEPVELHSQEPRIQRGPSTSLKNLQNAYNALINAAGKAGAHELAEALFTEMRQLGLKTDIYTYNALLRAVVEGRGVRQALRVVRRMEDHGLQADAHSLTSLLEGYCRKQQLDEAEDVLRYMKQGGPSRWPTRYSFNILLKACAAVEDPDRALRVFAGMKEAGVAPDNCTYVALLAACGSAKEGADGTSPWSQKEVARRVAAIEMDMAQCGVSHSAKSLTSVMGLLGAEGLTDAMLQRLEEAANSMGKRDLLDAASFNTVILSCLNSRQVETGWDVYHQMKASSVKPDVYTYNILINGCARDKSFAVAFELVDKMRKESLSPDVVTFNSLLKVVCHSGEMDIVLDLLQEMTAAGVEPDSATFNTILTSASYHKRLDVTEHVLEEMRRRHVLPNQHTLLPVVSMYMHAGRTDDAVEALRVLSLRILEGNGNRRVEFCKDAKLSQIQNILKDLARRSLNLGEATQHLLEDAVSHTSAESLAVYAAALALLVHGDDASWEHEQSSWTARLSMQYDRRKSAKFPKSGAG